MRQRRYKSLREKRGGASPFAFATLASVIRRSRSLVVVIVSFVFLHSLHSFFYIPYILNVPYMIHMQNPHEANPPDYADQRYAPTRQPLIDSFNILHADAAQCLLDIWTAQNLIKEQEWDTRREAEAEQHRQEQERLCIQQEEAECLHLQEEEIARQDKRKKNRNKFLPFNNVKVSSTIPINPSLHALRRLCKGEYVELHYFTNKGLAEAQSVSHSVDDEALALL